MVEREPWMKSTYSSGSQNCVEVAKGATTGVRDTQNRELGHLDVPAREWSALLDTLRAS
jgi:hypothetical protein